MSPSCRAAFVVWVGASAFSISGCLQKNPVSCVDGYCEDPALPFCDQDGALAGSPMTCIAVACTPGSVAGCRLDQAILCNNAGDDFDLSHCDHGCDPASGCLVKSCVPNTVSCGDRVVEQCDANGVLHTTACDMACIAAPMPHCAHVSPQYLPDVCDTLAAEASRDITTTETIDTNQAAVCNGGVVPQAGGPDLCVLRYGTFTVSSGGTARFVGNRAVAIVADDTLRISGTFDVSSRGIVPGPGAGGGGGGQASSIKGGGGAGFATPGAAGGSTTQTGGGVNGGAAYSPLTVSFLVGGARASVSGLSEIYWGGAGGGSATLISCRRSVLVDGTIQAGGGGGLGGHTFVPPATVPFAAGGGGGGSGGYVVLQALNIIVSGSLSANGGSGGCGKPSAAATGVDGADAQFFVIAPPACTPASNEGSGGAGGASSAAPQPGGPSSGGTPGGGGGSTGFFQTYTPIGVIPALTPSAVSPAFQQNKNISVR